MSKIIYEDKLTILLDDANNIVLSIECNLPVLGEGMDRIVYKLSNEKVLKVAKSIRASCINWDEIMIYENIKGKECIVHFPIVYEYEESYGFWYVCERITMSSQAMTEVLKFVPCLDCSDNAGYNKDGKLTIVDADRLNWTWFVRSENPYAKDV